MSSFLALCVSRTGPPHPKKWDLGARRWGHGAGRCGAGVPAASLGGSQQLPQSHICNCFLLILELTNQHFPTEITILLKNSLSVLMQREGWEPAKQRELSIPQRAPKSSGKSTLTRQKGTFNSDLMNPFWNNFVDKP